MKKTLTTLALTAALLAGGAGVASADGSFDWTKKVHENRYAKELAVYKAKKAFGVDHPIAKPVPSPVVTAPPVDWKPRSVAAPVPAASDDDKVHGHGPYEAMNAKRAEMLRRWTTDEVKFRWLMNR